ncbi:glucose-1-phosphate cytidylyltransferase [Flavobacteriaceae bacterium]|nr:glucose-1-phosphate cytidylyltransferase [Flavobacteriaceae bacterium]
MKVIILAGGFGTRLSEFTELIPKPMVKVGDKPIIWHIMNHYANYGHNDFYLALGYLSEVIKKYFFSYQSLQSDFSVSLKSGDVNFFNSTSLDWKVNCIDTGQATLTGKRIKKLQKYISNEPFLLTYGDGLSNVNIEDLVKFHKSHNKMITMTAVRPKARFGELSIDGNKVVDFKEKPQMAEGWINGGFFVIEPKFFDIIGSENVMLERAPLEKAANMGELMVYKHDGFWQCMDSKRDYDYLNELWNNKDYKWRE